MAVVKVDFKSEEDMGGKIGNLVTACSFFMPIKPFVICATLAFVVRPS